MRLLVFIYLLCLWPASANAGAWTQPGGQSQLILTTSHYHSDKRIEDSGITSPQPDYRKTALNPYYEYGFSEDLTLGANLFLLHVKQARQSNSGLGDSEFFARARVYRSDRWVISAEPMIKLPALQGKADAPLLGSRSADLGLTASAGYSFKALGRSHYLNLDSGYRYRFGSPEDQLKFSTTFGLSLLQRWSLLAQADTTLRVKSPQNSRFTQSSADDYDLVRTQFSVLYHHNETTRWQLGAFHHISGQNTGLGTGLLLSTWRIF